MQELASQLDWSVYREQLIGTIAVGGGAIVGVGVGGGSSSCMPAVSLDGVPELAITQQTAVLENWSWYQVLSPLRPLIWYDWPFMAIWTAL